MDKKQTREKLADLQKKLQDLEEVEWGRIKQLIINSDMGDDYRENEAAKLATEEQKIWLSRKYHLKMEINELKKSLHRDGSIRK